MKALYTLCCLLVCTSLSFAQATWFVDASNTGTQNGQSWSTAFADLQDAINAATAGDSVFVTSGTYKPTEMLGNGNTDRDKCFLLKSGVLVYGGFTGTEGSLNDRASDSASLHVTNTTTLSGDLGTAGDSSDNAYHVVVSLLHSTTTLLDGFTIRDGYANDTSSVVANGLIVDRNYGGGISLVTSFTTLKNLVVRDNISSRGGAGMNNFDSDPSMENSTFYRNRVWGDFSQDPNGGGAGMRNDASHPAITHAYFIQNSTYTNQGGGGMRNENGSNPVLEDVLFEHNHAEDGDGGAGMYCASGSSPVINNTIFRDNTTTDQGGGMYNDSSIPYLTDVRFEGNFGGGGSGAMENDAGSDVDMLRVQFVDNSTWENGGAVQNWQSSPSMIDVVFEGNHADGDGGALYNYNNCSPQVTNAILRNNTCDGNGGAIYNRRNCNPVITNALVHGNYAGINGGGIFSITSNGSPSSPILTNSTVADNEASNSGGGAYDDGAGNSLLRNSIIHGNIALSNDDVDAPASMAVTALYYAIIGNEYYTFGSNTPTTFTGNVFTDISNDDFHLATFSPAINMGDSSFYAGSATPNISSVTTDLDGNDRVIGSNIDLGVYETCINLVSPTAVISVSPADSVQENTAVTFTATMTNTGANPALQWHKNNSPISGATTTSYTATANVDFVDGDAFSLWVQSSAFCLEQDTVWSNVIAMEVTLAVDTTDTGDSTIHIGMLQPEPSLILFPNPNHGQFTLRGYIPGRSIELHITDVTGRSFHRERVTAIGEELNLQRDLSDRLKPGIYFLHYGNGKREPTALRFIVSP